MKQVLVIYQCDNGYKCSCCNEEWEEHETHDIPETQNIQEFATKHQKEIKQMYDQENSFCGRYGKFKILKIYVITDEFEFEF